MTREEISKELVKNFNDTNGNKHLRDGIDCDMCLNKGEVHYVDKQGYVKFSKCPKCTHKRNYFDRVELSGLRGRIEHYTFDKFNTEKNHHKLMLNKAYDFLNEKDKFIVLSGNVGSGKTHIATAIANNFMLQGKDVLFKSYTSDIYKLQKELQSGYLDIKDRAEHELEMMKNVDVLFIDDFLKSMPKEIETIHALIDYRLYKGVITIITTEKYYEELVAWDYAVASRIFEKTDGWKYFIEISREENKNERENR